MAVQRMSSALKQIFSVLLLIFVGCLLVALIRTLQIKPPPTLELCLKNDTDYISDSRGLLNRLSETIRFKTISTDKHTYNTTELERFRNFIIKTFPLIHSSKFISYEVISGYSLLYTVRGQNEKLQPYMLAAHLDVVPVDESQWTVPPFDGVIVNDTLFGRGTLDNKCNLMGMMEALEFSIENGIQPVRGFYMAFGHDEEVQGLDGAQEIGKILEQRGVRLLYLLDEGTFIVHNAVAGLNSPAGLVGVTEKGYLTIKLSAYSKPGHSSIPPSEMAINILSKALAKLDKLSQPNLFGQGAEVEMLRQAAPYARFPYRFIYSNIWLFAPLVSWFFTSSPLSDANIRSTTAFTMIGGGIKENVLPNTAWAIINHRVHPAQKNIEVVERDRYLINDDRVTIEVLSTEEAHPFSPHDDASFGYQTIKRTVSQFVPDLAVLPICMVGNTDTRWYLKITDSIYRFSVFDLDKNQAEIIHGHDERITRESYERVVNFYFHLMKNSNLESLPKKEPNSDL